MARNSHSHHFGKNRLQNTVPKRVPYLRLVKPHRKLPPMLSKRDPHLIRKIYPYLAALSDHYYRAEVEGLENLNYEASLVVSTHNGSINTPDLYCLMVAFWRRFGLETPGYGLMHKVAFKVPLLGEFLTKLGALPASNKNGNQVLDAGFPLLVCPGGDMDALKPFKRRHQITFGNRKGFIKMAIRKGVPIIPVVSVGAHETLFILNDGKWLARLLRTDRIFRLKSVPFSFSAPFGFTIGGLLSIPLPSKIRIRVLEPIHMNVPREAEHDEATVERCFQKVKQTMQASLDDLAAQRKWPVIG